MWMMGPGSCRLSTRKFAPSPFLSLSAFSISPPLASPRLFYRTETAFCRGLVYLEVFGIAVPNNPNVAQPFSTLVDSHKIMIKLFKVKEQQRENAENANGRAPVKKQSAGELRLHKDISELNLPKAISISFPNGKDDLMYFEVTIRPDEGYYHGGNFVFTFQVPPIYPHEAPKVKCKTKVYHPNIDLEGNVCLNILREDWKPVLNINTIIYGLNYLFTEPNHEDPLNHDAAAVLRDNPKMFESNVRRAMTGGYVAQTFFPRCV